MWARVGVSKFHNRLSHRFLIPLEMGGVNLHIVAILEGRMSANLLSFLADEGSGNTGKAMTIELVF